MSFTRLPIQIFDAPPVYVNATQTSAILTNNKNFKLTVHIDAVPKIPQNCTLFDYKAFCVQHPEHAHLQFATQAEEEPIEMLIGSDYFWHFLKNESKVVINENTFLVNTEFGWILVGQTENEFSSRSACFYSLKPKQILDQLCELDVIGIQDLPKSTMQEEEAALKQFYENLTFRNNRYEIRWPWKSYPPQLPNNYGLAFGRLRSLLRQLTPDLFKEYNSILEKQLSDGIIEDVPTEDAKNENSYYLPHHAVIQPEKSTPVRIVYDESCGHTI